jgi:hypothetical protein
MNKERQTTINAVSQTTINAITRRRTTPKGVVRCFEGRRTEKGAEVEGKG